MRSTNGFNQSFNDRDNDMNDTMGASHKYSYYDSSMAKSIGTGAIQSYVPHKSPIKHMPMADDNRKSKFADEVYHDMEDRKAYDHPFTRYPETQYMQRSVVVPNPYAPPVTTQSV